MIRPCGRQVRRLSRWGLLCFVLVCLSGCWDQRPIETRASVLAIAVAPGPKPSLDRFTFVFPNATVTTESVPSIPPAEETFAISVVAPTMPDAITAVQQRESRALYFGQIRLLVLSDRLSTTTARQLLAGIVQNGHVLLTFWVVMSPHATQLATSPSPTEAIPEVALYRALACHCQAFRWPGRAWAQWADSVTVGTTPVLPVVDLTQGSFALTTVAFWTPMGVHPLTPAAAEGWAYLTDRILQGEITLSTAASTPSVARIHGRTQVRFRFQRNRVVLTDTLYLTGTIVGGGWQAGTRRAEAAIEQAVSQKILQDCLAAVQQARATAVDPFGWHRDLLWGHARETATHPGWVTGWQDWQIRIRVHFAVRNLGVLR